jgi:hypothetical protein
MHVCQARHGVALPASNGYGSIKLQQEGKTQRTAQHNTFNLEIVFGSGMIHFFTASQSGKKMDDHDGSLLPLKQQHQDRALLSGQKLSI